MAWIKTPKRQANWDSHWNPDVLKLELAKKDRSLRAILRAYSTEATGWQGLYRDVVRWRKADPEMEMALQDHIQSVSKKRGNGRKRLDQQPDTDGWMVDFCEEYLKERNKQKASLVTPYKYQSILAKLDPSKSEYSQHFTDMVAACDMQLLEWAKEIVYAQLESAVKDPLVSQKDKAWIGMQIAKSAKGSDWGNQRLDITHKGTIQFEARRALMVSEMVQSQSDFFEKHRAKLLPTGTKNVHVISDSEQVIEAQLLDVE